MMEAIGILACISGIATWDKAMEPLSWQRRLASSLGITMTIIGASMITGGPMK